MLELEGAYPLRQDAGDCGDLGKRGPLQFDVGLVHVKSLRHLGEPGAGRGTVAGRRDAQTKIAAGQQIRGPDQPTGDQEPRYESDRPSCCIDLGVKAHAHPSSSPSHSPAERASGLHRRTPRA